MKRGLLLLFGMITTLLLTAGLALAQQQGDPAGRPPSLVELLWQMLPMFLLVYFIFYFMVSRPQQLKQREQQKLLSELTNGEMVVTTGGIVAKVADKKQDLIVLDTGSGAKFKVLPQHITGKYAKPDKGK